jgi:hypothetical protein
MMADPINRPLWQVMYAAYDQSKAPDDVEYWEDNHGYAAEIRAVADWLEAMWTAQGPPSDIPVEFIHGLSIGMEIHREGTLNILRIEADRAEAGE